MNGFFHIMYHKNEQDVCFKMIPHICRLVLMSGFYEELSVPTPIPEMLIFSLHGCT